MKNINVQIILIVLIASMFFVGTASAKTSGDFNFFDYFGYTFIDSNPTGTASIASGAWTDIGTTGTPILPDNDDSFTSVPIGFNFTFYGINYSMVNATNNGLILGGAGTGQYINQEIGRSGPHNFIAPFWDDIVTWDTPPGPDGSIYYRTIGLEPDRMFIVEWLNNQHYRNSTQGITFEVVLYENNSIEFRYKDISFGDVYGNTSADLGPYDNGGSATVGIEGPGGSGLQYSFNEQRIIPGLVIRFNPPPISTGPRIFLSKEAPISMDQGGTMNYVLNYYNTGTGNAIISILNDTLPPEVVYGGCEQSPPDIICGYDGVTRNVTWNFFNGKEVLPGLTGFSKTVTVTIRSDIALGNEILNNAYLKWNKGLSFFTNTTNATTKVNKFDLPPGVSLGPATVGSDGKPSLHYNEPITFNYTSSCNATDVTMNITLHKNSTTDIKHGYHMTSTDGYNWTVTIPSFSAEFGAWGNADVTYTPSCSPPVSFKIYVDPSGYIYDALTGVRIPEATVWLQRPNGLGGWDNVSIGQEPPVMLPDINPLTTNDNGQYEWNTLPGVYRVYVTAPNYYPKESIAVVVSEGHPVTDLNVGLTRDTTPPKIEITVPTTGASYILNQPVAASYSCSDDFSGVATCTGTVANGANIDTGTVGPKSFSVTSTDNAGNTATLTNTYNVDYSFNGFLRPIDNLPTLNALKAGSAVPVKFSLNGDQGLDIFEAGYPRSAVTQCDSTAPVDAVDEISTAGSSGLSYDAITDQYNYVWKTEKAWAGSCRQLVVMLKDGTDHRANFKLVK